MEISERNERTDIIRRILELLLVAFIVLKLTGVITWSWWWVLSPLWLPWVLFAFAWLIITIMSFLLLGGRNKYNKFR